MDCPLTFFKHFVNLYVWVFLLFSLFFKVSSGFFLHNRVATLVVPSSVWHLGATTSSAQNTGHRHCGSMLHYCLAYIWRSWQSASYFSLGFSFCFEARWCYGCPVKDRAQ